MLSQLSHLTHSGGVEASLATAMLEASVTSAVRYTATNWNPLWRGLWAWGTLTVQAHCLNRYTFYPPPQPFGLYLPPLTYAEKICIIMTWHKSPSDQKVDGAWAHKFCKRCKGSYRFCKREAHRFCFPI